MNSAILYESELRKLLEETARSLANALAAAESVGRHGIVESRDFDRLMEFLREAKDIVKQAKRNGPASPTTIFLTRTAAETVLNRHLSDATTFYRIEEEVAGRYLVGIFKLAGYL